MVRISRNVFLAAVLALSLGACGRKTDVERPPAVGPGASKEENAQAQQDLKNRPFILDPLLR